MINQKSRVVVWDWRMKIEASHVGIVYIVFFTLFFLFIGARLTGFGPPLFAVKIKKIISGKIYPYGNLSWLVGERFICIDDKQSS